MALQRLVSGETQGQAFLWSLKWLHKTHRGIIFYEFSGELLHPLMLMDVVWSSCFHTKTWDILPEWELLFSKLFLTSALNLLLTHPPPPWPMISNQASLLKQMTPAISNISEKEMQEDQQAFLFPWGWLFLVSSDFHKARAQVPVMGCSFLLCTSPQPPLERPGFFFFCTKECPTPLAVVRDCWRLLHFKCTRTYPGQFPMHLSTLDKRLELGSNSCINIPAIFLLLVSYLPHRYPELDYKIQKITSNSPVTDAKGYSWIYHGNNIPQLFQYTIRFLHAWLDLEAAECPAASLLLDSGIWTANFRENWI